MSFQLNGPQDPSCDHVTTFIRLDASTRFGITFITHVWVDPRAAAMLELPDCAVVVQPSGGISRVVGWGIGHDRTEARVARKLLQRARARLEQDIERAQADLSGEDVA